MTTTTTKESLILVNDIKEGAYLKLKEGGQGIMRDSKKGIIRTIEILPDEFNMSDIGSTYTDRITYVYLDVQDKNPLIYPKPNEDDGEWVKVAMTKAQKKKMDEVYKFYY